jgi:hypothetical protein
MDSIAPRVIQQTRVIVGDHREQARSYRGDSQSSHILDLPIWDLPRIRFKNETPPSAILRSIWKYLED